MKLEPLYAVLQHTEEVIESLTRRPFKDDFLRGVQQGMAISATLWQEALVAAQKGSPSAEEFVLGLDALIKELDGKGG